MRKPIITILLIILAITTTSAYAQEDDTIQLKLRRDFGYGGGVDIQGTFSMSVSGPDNLTKVEYFIDGNLMGESVDAPSFRYKFITGDYQLGMHTLSAFGYTADGQTLPSNEITKNFVSAEEGWSAAIKIIVIVLGLMGGVTLLSYGITRLVGGKKPASYEPGATRSYGVLGGTICPKCGRTFSRHVWGLNIGVGKFDRCPHCGKWSVTHRASPSELRAAELSELETIIEKPGSSDEERLQKDLENSRFEDL